MIILIFISVIFLAFSNGANDNFKGVATLFGSGTTNYKKAINWATITTLFGSTASIFFAATLVKNFSGKGLIPDALITTPSFAVAVALGAALTVFIATKIGMPVSTTHGLVGALTGAGLVAVGLQFNFAKLGGTFFLPLILSPLIGAVLSFTFYYIFREGKRRSGIRKDSCACIVEEQSVSSFDGTATVLNSLTIKLGKESDCKAPNSGTIAGVTVTKSMDMLHFISAGAVSFARGLNDTPKMVGLLLVVQSQSINFGLAVIAIAIAAGGLLNAKKVGETMSKKITAMNHEQGLTANLVTALLVTMASFNGLPVSTTHVSVGSLFGIGTASRQANGKVISGILLSWLLTLPVAAIISAVVYFFISKINF